MKPAEAIIIGIVCVCATAVALFGHGGLGTEGLLGIYGTALGYAGGRFATPKIGP